MARRCSFKASSSGSRNRIKTDARRSSRLASPACVGSTCLQRLRSSVDLSRRLGLAAGSKSVLERKLNGPPRQPRIDKDLFRRRPGPEAAEGKLMHRDAELRPVEEIEELAAEIEPVAVAELEGFGES